MHVFLTGATGLLGINTTAVLLARGHTVTALVRDRAKAERVLPRDGRIRILLGDMAQPDEWLGALRGFDALIHTAAYFREAFGRGDHAAKLEAWNVALPVRLAQAASDFGLQKTIIISSSGVVAKHPNGGPTDETLPPQTAVPENAYFVSKVRMENALRDLAPRLKNSLILIRPGWMYGPNDYAPTNAGELVRQLIHKGSVQMVSGAPVNTVDARDVAAGIVAALEKADGYEIFHIAGAPRTAVDTLRLIAKETGGKVQEVPLPAALFLSRVLEPISRLQNKPNPVPRIGLLTLSRGVAVSSEKAVQQLGVRFRPFEDTARDTAAFFRTQFMAGER
jgi:dihydroflavonol-4-reductase